LTTLKAGHPTPAQHACISQGDSIMSHHLTAGQRALLEAALLQRQHQLDARLAEHHQGLTRAEHAADLREQDNDDAPQRETERELDLAISDRETTELGAVSAALRRLRADDYGICRGCGCEIPFDRLKAEPWALRCVDCESRMEAGRRSA
jgi:DnaK suppressor protein